MYVNKIGKDKRKHPELTAPPPTQKELTKVNFVTLTGKKVSRNNI